MCFYVKLCINKRAAAWIEGSKLEDAALGVPVPGSEVSPEELPAPCLPPALVLLGATSPNHPNTHLLSTNSRRNRTLDTPTRKETPPLAAHFAGGPGSGRPERLRGRATASHLKV